MIYHVNGHRLNHSAPLLTYNRTLEARVHDYIGGCDVTPTPFSGSMGFSTSGTDTNDYTGVGLVSGGLSSLWYDPTSIQITAT